MFNPTDAQIFEWLSRAQPSATALICGSDRYPEIRGTAKFYQTNMGVYTVVSVTGLPQQSSECDSRIFALHIHNGKGCYGDSQDPFSGAGTHYNPDNCPHPYHAGDLPPLFSAGGIGWSVFLTDRFTVREVTGLTIVIHLHKDDFTTQPSGDSGEKIACGIIKIG